MSPVSDGAAEPLRVWTIPNLLSFLRLLGVPLFLWLLLVPHADGWAFVVLVLSAVSDWADGKLARLLNQYSKLGELLDPLADRLYLLATLVAFVIRGFIPWWVAALIIGRDIVLAVCIPLIRRHGYPPLPVQYLGKAATFCLLYALPLLLSRRGAQPSRRSPGRSPMRSPSGAWRSTCGQACSIWVKRSGSFATAPSSRANSGRPRGVCRVVDGPGAESSGASVDLDAASGSTSSRAASATPGRHRHNPPAALLTSLLGEGIDPGYAEAAARKATSDEAGRTLSPPARSRRARTAGYVAVGVLVVGVVFGVAARATQQAAPSADKDRQSLLDDVHGAQGREGELEASISVLNSQIRSAQAALGATGPLESLSSLAAAGGLTPVRGPGLQIIIDEGGGESGQGILLDSDIQLLVNGLWASGAEAVSVGGVRLRTTSAIRQAGGAILVDNQPVFWPITIDAVGDPNTIHVAFVQTDGFARFSAFSSLYGIRFDLSASSSLSLAAAATPEVRYASVPATASSATDLTSGASAASGTTGTTGTTGTSGPASSTPTG